MKTIKLLIPALLMILFIQNALAKQTIGLYLTADDFYNHKLSFESDGSNGNKILLHAVFGGFKVIVVQNGIKQQFSKSQIYGYRLNDQDYRYVNNSAYRVIDSKGFFLYGYCKLIPEGKHLKEAEFFYFSSKADDEVKPLTMNNLQAVFSKNTKFLYTVQGFFKSDGELTSYDPNLKEYKLKYLYAQTSR